jgi:hypothetical protein
MSRAVGIFCETFGPSAFPSRPTLAAELPGPVSSRHHPQASWPAWLSWLARLAGEPRRASQRRSARHRASRPDSAWSPRLQGHDRAQQPLKALKAAPPAGCTAKTQNHLTLGTAAACFYGCRLSALLVRDGRSAYRPEVGFSTHAPISADCRLAQCNESRCSCPRLGASQPTSCHPQPGQHSTRARQHPSPHVRDIRTLAAMASWLCSQNTPAEIAATRPGDGPECHRPLGSPHRRGPPTVETRAVLVCSDTASWQPASNQQVPHPLPFHMLGTAQVSNAKASSCRAATEPRLCVSMRKREGAPGQLHGTNSQTVRHPSRSPFKVWLPPSSKCRRDHAWQPAAPGSEPPSRYIC